MNPRVLVTVAMPRSAPTRPGDDRYGRSIRVKTVVEVLRRELGRPAWPREEVARYEALFAGRAYLPASVTRSLTDPVRAAASSTPPRRHSRPAHREPRQLALSI